MSIKARRVCLPNGLTVYQDDPKTTKIVYSHITDYLQHKIRVREGMTVFDVGANTGLFALEVLHRCKGRVNLFCFEPAPATYGLLKHNVSEQFPDSVVNLYHCGLSSKIDQATLYYRPCASFMSSLKKDVIDENANIELWTNLAKDPNLPAEYRERIPGWVKFLPRSLIRLGVAISHRRTLKPVLEVPCDLTTVSQIIEEESISRIDLLKIDVEGAELDVLLGIEDTDWPKIEALVVEVHDENDQLESIKNLLKQHGSWEIAVEQDYVFRGTNLFNLYACRSNT